MRPVDRVNWINVALMVASCGLALWLPFEVFLVAYAVLGPLHYLTQIAWLHQRSYFAPSRAAFLPLALGVVAALSWIALRPQPLDLALAVTLLGGSFLAALALATLATPRAQAAGVAASFALAWALAQISPLALGVALLLPTIVHVFVFTAGFIALGALRAQSASGWISLGVLAACAALLLALPATPGPLPSDAVRDAFAGFVDVHALLSQILGYEAYRELAEVFTSPAGVRVQRFIAFAYLYHYLNWFSKTSVIQWHRIPRPWAVANVAVWAASVALYAWDYRTGLAWLYALSLLHVVLEFPLDHKTFLEIGRRLAPGARA